MRSSNNILLITTVLASASLQAQTITRDNGSPVGDNQNSITAGANEAGTSSGCSAYSKTSAFCKRAYPRA